MALLRSNKDARQIFALLLLSKTDAHPRAEESLQMGAAPTKTGT